jgi:hypothetical protein
MTAAVGLRASLCVSSVRLVSGRTMDAAEISEERQMDETLQMSHSRTHTCGCVMDCLDYRYGCTNAHECMHAAIENINIQDEFTATNQCDSLLPRTLRKPLSLNFCLYVTAPLPNRAGRSGASDGSGHHTYTRTT